MDREFRASEVAALMPSEHALQLAIKYASRISKITLAEKVGDIAENRVYGRARMALQQADDDQDEDDVDVVHRSRPDVDETECNDDDDQQMELESDSEFSRSSSPCFLPNMTLMYVLQFQAP